MAATTTPITAKKAQPRFKLAQFRDVAIESQGLRVGVDLELDAGSYEITGVDPDTGETVVLDTVTVADGDVVHVPHPLMLSDERQDVFDKFNRGEDLDQEEYTDPDTGTTKTKPVRPATIGGQPAPGDTYRMAAAILGEHELHRLLAGGGHSNDVAIAWNWLTTDNRLDSDPKALKPRR